MDDLNKKTWARIGWFLFEKGLTGLFTVLIYVLVFFLFFIALDFLVSFVSFSTEYVFVNGFKGKYIIMAFVSVVVAFAVFVLFAVQKNIVAELKKDIEK